MAVKDRGSLRERNRTRTRAEILAAAAHLLGDADSAAFSMEQLASAAAVSRGTLYSYFPGARDEVLRELYAETAERVRVRGLALRSEQVETADRIAALAAALIETSATPEGRFYGAVTPELAMVVATLPSRTSAHFEAMVLQDLTSSQRVGQLAPELDAELLAVMLGGAIRAAGEAAAHGTSDDRTLIQAIRALVARTLTT